MSGRHFSKYRHVPGFFRVTTALYCSLLSGVAAATVDSTSVSIASDRLYHGITESTTNPNVAIRSEIGADHWFAGAVVEFARRNTTVERHKAATSFIGWSQSLGEQGWDLSATAQYRKFIDSNKEWDYWEFTALLRSGDGFSLTVDHAPDYYAHGIRANVVQASQFKELGDRMYGLASLGYASLSNEQDYAFGTLAGGWMLNRSTLEVAFDWHTLNGRYRFRDRVQSNTLRVTLAHRLR